MSLISRQLCHTNPIMAARYWSEWLQRTLSKWARDGLMERQGHLFSLDLLLTWDILESSGGAVLQREEVKIGLGRLRCTATLLGPPCIENPTHRRGPSSNQVREKPEGDSCHEQTPETKQTIFQKVLHECKRRGMPDRLTSQATRLSYPVISAGKMAYGFLPTCVQTNQLWPGDSRSDHICESETTFLGTPLLAYPPGWLCRARGQGVTCCWGTEHFWDPCPWCLPPWSLSRGLVMLSSNRTDEQPSAYRGSCLQKGMSCSCLLTAQASSQHPATLSLPNTGWKELRSALELRPGGEWQGEAPREWS